MERNSRLTPFGFKCKHCLVDRCMTMTELARLVHEDTGLFCDARYLVRIFNGDRKAPRIINSICKILDISYEEK